MTILSVLGRTWCAKLRPLAAIPVPVEILHWWMGQTSWELGTCGLWRIRSGGDGAGGVRGPFDRVIITSAASACARSVIEHGETRLVALQIVVSQWLGVVVVSRCRLSPFLSFDVVAVHHQLMGCGPSLLLSLL